MELNERVRRCEDDKYRWIYELDMHRNPSIFLTVVKVTGICFLVPLGLLLFLELRARNPLSVIIRNLKPVWISFAVIAVIVPVAYQFEEQFEKQQIIAAFTAAIGALTGNSALAGSSYYNTERSQAYSDFKKIYSLKGYKKRDLIKVNSPFLFNQVYVQKEDFDFVERYIRDHCPKLK